ncbi:PAS domain S-box-containing protein [Labrys wisconsinensis]|uniref:Blue-light-activated histidine kinase n=1 Tax=Labrys wisconsinensis TaxID=425677 RepID=A0ABU0JFA1_9HYPH|nr:PAS domain S-box-containing protein [Labrys wisconsinensis]
MNADEKVNILLVDDQPAKLLSYEVMLRDLDETLLKASTAREALEQLLRADVAVVLMDVNMPELDGFELAAMIREHPRFQHTAIIFVSAVRLAEPDFLRGYEMGAVDYVPVPVVPQVLRAKVRVFAELHRKTRQLEQLNRHLEMRVAERTRALEDTAARLQQSEERRSLALEAGQMGSWDWDVLGGECRWDKGQYRIGGVDPASFAIESASVEGLVHADDRARLRGSLAALLAAPGAAQAEFRVLTPRGQRWCFGTAASIADEAGRVARVSGVTIDITERKVAEERQALLAREVDHRAKNALALVQSIVRLSKAETVQSYVDAVNGRIKALARAHTLLAESRWQGADLRRLIREELAPYRDLGAGRIGVRGEAVMLEPRDAQSVGLALHELATNAAKYGALSVDAGHLDIEWRLEDGRVVLTWRETGGPPPVEAGRGLGLRVIVGGIEQQLAGQARFDWRPGGLVCTLSFPVAAPAVRPNGPAADAGSASEGAARQVLRRGRVLLVEDEALIATMMRDLLAEMGCSIIGPHASVAEAAAAIAGQRPDAAILDVNLGGEFIFPVAESLRALGVPFAFVTGYGRDMLDTHFPDVPVFEKPIDRDQFIQAFAP